MNNSPFETLIESKHYKTAERWYPIAAETYRLAFKIDTSIENSVALRKNLSYSMQYLEFLEKEMKELKLSDVIYVVSASRPENVVFTGHLARNVV